MLRLGGSSSTSSRSPSSRFTPLPQNWYHQKGPPLAANIIMKRLAKLIIIAALILLTVYYLRQLLANPEFNQYFFGAKNNILSRVAVSPVNRIIDSELKNKPGRWAVSILDLKTGQSWSKNKNERFGSASLYKLAVMWAAFDAIERGTLARDQFLADAKSRLDLLAEDRESVTLASTLGESVSLTVDETLLQMITISDNYSALLLAEKLGWENIDALMEKKGLPDFNLAGPDSPNVTAGVVGDLLARIYSGTAVSATASQEMRDLLFAQKINDRIPKYLPADVRVGHKTGELDTLKHDAGIVMGKNSHYIFVFLTETGSPADAAEQIATLSQKIYAELEK